MPKKSIKISLTKKINILRKCLANQEKFDKLIETMEQSKTFLEPLLVASIISKKAGERVLKAFNEKCYGQQYHSK